MESQSGSRKRIRLAEPAPECGGGYEEAKLSRKTKSDHLVEQGDFGFPFRLMC